MKIVKVLRLKEVINVCNTSGKNSFKIIEKIDDIPTDIRAR